MFKRCLFWLGNSRLFSLPMTFMSWIVVFVYAMKSGGNIFNGILALIGISFAHLATNLFDDYIDYKTLSKNEEFMHNTVKSKCAYIKNGDATLNQLLRVVTIYCAIAFIIGVYLTLQCGWGTAFLALIGGIITLSYAKMSSNGLSELAVGTAFGPLLFEGVYYVMCGKFSTEVFILSLAVVVFTVGLLYVHTLMDYDADILAGKKTLCIRLGNKKNALLGLIMLYSIGYLMCIVLFTVNHNYLYFLPLVTIPIAVLLKKSIEEYYKNPYAPAIIHFWNYPLEGWDKIKADGTENFYLRLYLARNLMVWFTITIIIAVVL